jgi:hypothetical protein
MKNQDKIFKLNKAIQAQVDQNFVLSCNDIKVKFKYDIEQFKDKITQQILTDILFINLDTYFNDLPSNVEDTVRKLVDISSTIIAKKNIQMLIENQQISSSLVANGNKKKQSKQLMIQAQKFNDKYTKDMIIKEAFLIFETCCNKNELNVNKLPRRSISYINDAPAVVFSKSYINDIEGIDDFLIYFNNNESKFNEEFGRLFADLFDLHKSFLDHISVLCKQEQDKIFNNIAHKSA